MADSGSNGDENIKHYGFSPYWLDHFARFEEEVRHVYTALVVSTVGQPGPLALQYTLWSYIARCFAFTDWFSRYWSLSDRQTRRMAAFMRRYMGRASMDGPRMLR